jgi:predicted extracellular nuclease
MMIIHRLRLILAIFLGVFLLAGGMAGLPPARGAAPVELFISEYIEGSSNNKAVEIYNGTNATINLATGGYAVLMYFNGATSAGLTINLTGSVLAGDVYVVAHSSAVSAILAQADQTAAGGWFNGNDSVVLRKGGAVIDAIGQVGFDPGIEWGSGLTSTNDNTLRRKDIICTGDGILSDPFDPSIEWVGYAVDTFGGLGAHTTICNGDDPPEVISTDPANGAAGVPLTASLTVTFSEPVNVSGSWFGLDCTVSGTHPGGVSGGPSTFVIDPTTDFSTGDACTLTIFAANVTDQDVEDPPDNMAANFGMSFSTDDPCALAYTPIYNIQGSGSTAALTGHVTTQGIVVGDYEGASPALQGFYLQDSTGDGNPATSDGIFVFNAGNNSVSLGDRVRVNGVAGEYQEQTQISASALIDCGSGTVNPQDVTLPFAAADFAERYEGMLVRLPQTLYVTEHFQLGRFGQVVLSSGGRLQQPTHVTTPGAAALSLQAANDLNRIILDDGMNDQNPDPILFGRNGLPLSAANTLRGGDTVSGIVGVMTYGWAGNSASGNAFRVRPVNALGGLATFSANNPRPGPALPLPDGLRVAGLNLLNYFNTFGSSACTNGVGGTPTDCRGADDSSEFNRQWPKTVAAILQVNPAILGVVELENDGYGPGSAIQDLVAKLNVATSSGTFTFIDADAATGQVNALGVDAIKVGFIYQPGVISPTGQTAALNSPAFVNGGDATARNRPALAQAFQNNQNGEVFIFVVNHLKSKGSACDTPDAGDGQGNCNLVRTNAAQALVSWLSTDPTGTGDQDILILGDLNSYSREDPIAAIEAAGYTNLLVKFQGPDAYSYVFNGQWGYLDHALASAGMLPQVTGALDDHINADEPSVLDYNDDFKSAAQLVGLYSSDEFRAADHDPLVVSIQLMQKIVLPLVMR